MEQITPQNAIGLSFLLNANQFPTRKIIPLIISLTCLYSVNGINRLICEYYSNTKWSNAAYGKSPPLHYVEYIYADIFKGQKKDMTITLSAM